MPPLWCAMIVAQLRAAGLRGECHDVTRRVYREASGDLARYWHMDRLHFWRREKDLQRLLAMIGPGLEQAAERILARRPPVVGFTTTDANLLTSLHVARLIRRSAPDTRIVLGGPSMYWLSEGPEGTVPNSLCDPWTQKRLDTPGLVDVAVRGEADAVVAPLFSALLEGSDPGGVPGTMVPLGQSWHVAPPPEPPDMNLLPVPDYSDLIPAGQTERRLPLLTSRGCLRCCAFCNDFRMQGAYRSRNAEHLFREVETLHRRHGTRFFPMADLMINGDLEQLERFCDLIIDARLPVEWAGQAIINPDMDAGLLRRMARAGCKSMTFGVESFSQPVVDAMGKGFQVTDALRLMNDTMSAGVDVAINLLVGFPGEEEQHFQETCSVLEFSRPFIGRLGAVNVCHLTPRSRIARHREQLGINTNMPEHWFRWSGPHDNTHETRQRRQRELAEHATRLGLPPREQNRYDAQAVRITSLALLDDLGRQREEHPPGEPLRVEIRYEAQQSAARALFRVQLLRSGDDLLAFGHNTGLARGAVDRLPPGQGRVTMRLARLNLAPGEYRVTAGVWPDEDSVAPLDVRHGALTLRVAGEQRDPLPLARVGLQAERAAGARPDGKTHALRFDGDQGGPPPRLGPGESLAAMLPLPALDGEEARLLAMLTSGQVMVHLAEVSPELLEGDTLLRLLYHRPPLLPGTYHLALDLQCVSTGRQLLYASRPFLIEGPIAGGGIVAHQVTWRLDPA